MTGREGAGGTWEWTAAQSRAIARLEAALAAADKAGVAVCGMDDTLTAYPADHFDQLATTLPSAYEVQQALIEADEYHAIDHRGAYRESGGW